MSPLCPVTDVEMPGLFQVADTAAARAECAYSRLVKADLSLLVFGSFFSSLSFTGYEAKTTYAIVGASLLCLAFIVSLGLRFARYERSWYGGRAIAESVKTLVWRYMTGTQPFPKTLNEPEADGIFTRLLSEILEKKKQLAFEFDEERALAPQISSRMRELRAGALDIRRDTYLRYRVSDQKNWYSKKAGFNQRRERVYFWLALVTQFFGMVYAFYVIGHPSLINLSGTFTALTVALFSWMQIRKFQELAQVYAVTAQELGMIETKSRNLHTNAELSDFISDAESAISREHTLWVARRDH